MPRLLDTVPVKLTRNGAVRSRHQVEVLSYHVRGWAHVRCLDHGLTDVQLYDGADTRKTAVSGARACAHRSALPYAHGIEQRLDPTPQVAAVDNAAAVVALALISACHGDLDKAAAWAAGADVLDGGRPADAAGGSVRSLESR
jgi:hypothetical protein